ncbi:MAG: 2-deoxy-5-keto-D-gluconate 6-phosphate aldolase domain-containing protein [Acidobacteriota bacterium]
MRQIGYDRPLFVQPFDHRGSFTKTFFGFKGTPRIEPAEEQHIGISEAKTLIYRGLLRAIEMGVPRDAVCILVDAQFGAHIIADAKSKRIPVAVCVEKSSQNLFDFEYGPCWQDHLRFLAPDIVKVLVRFHPQDDVASNREQLTRLKLLSDYVHSTDNHYFMFELLVPPTTDGDKKAGDRYDAEIRPRHMVEAIRMLQDFGIEPDIWKIEGLDQRKQAEAVAEQVRSGEGRQRVGSIVLGRGSNKEKVHQWLKVAAPVPSFIGFAVGRTNFSEPLKRFVENHSEEEAAVEAIARNYKECVDTWRQARAG